MLLLTLLYSLSPFCLADNVTDMVYHSDALLSVCPLPSPFYEMNWPVSTVVLDNVRSFKPARQGVKFSPARKYYGVCPLITLESVVTTALVPYDAYGVCPAEAVSPADNAMPSNGSSTARPAVPQETVHTISYKRMLQQRDLMDMRMDLACLLETTQHVGVILFTLNTVICIILTIVFDLDEEEEHDILPTHRFTVDRSTETEKDEDEAAIEAAPLPPYIKKALSECICVRFRVLQLSAEKFRLTESDPSIFAVYRISVIFDKPGYFANPEKTVVAVYRRTSEGEAVLNAFAEVNPSIVEGSQPTAGKLAWEYIVCDETSLISSEEKEKFSFVHRICVQLDNGVVARRQLVLKLKQRVSSPRTSSSTNSAVEVSTPILGSFNTNALRRAKKALNAKLNAVKRVKESVKFNLRDVVSSLQKKRNQYLVHSEC